MREPITIFSLLKTARFLPLFICQFLGSFGDTLIRTALGTMITYMSGDLSSAKRAIIISLALGLYTIPFILFSSIAGQLADKYNKAKLIQIVRLTSSVITLIGILGFALHSYLLLLVS